MSSDPNQPDLFTLARANDPVTSHEAGASISDKISAMQERVLDYAKTHPLGFTDRDLEEYGTGTYRPSTLRKRRCELTDRGLIRHQRLPSGELAYRTYPPAGRRHIVWEAC